MAKRVLYISYDGMTDPLGQSQVLPYLRGLSAHGFHFTLISCEKPERFEKNRARIDAICSEAGIGWHPLPYTKRPPVLSTIMDLRRIGRTARALHQAQPFDMVHCRGHVPALVGLEMKRRYGIGFLFDNRGFWADEKVDAGAWNRSNPVFNAIYRFFKRREKAFIEECDHMVCLTHAGKADMLRWPGLRLDAGKVTVIPCCADMQLFSPANSEANRARFAEELGVKDSNDAPLLVYLGSIGTWYMLDEMLDFFYAFRKLAPGARLLFITQDEHARIRETVAAKGMPPESVLIRPAQRDEIPGLLALAHYSLYFIRPTYSKISSSPTKQGEIMAMGMPVVCNAGVGDNDRIVTTHGAGVLVGDFSAEAYSAAARRLLDTPFNHAHIRRGAEETFSLSGGVTNYLDIYKRILA